MTRTLAAAALFVLLAGCGRAPSGPPAEPVEVPAPAPRTDGGLPARGPGDLYNGCERIWCASHAANFALDHFLRDHDGWILHAKGQGDVFVPRGWNRSPGFPNAGAAALNLCGEHLHPWLLGRESTPVRKTGYNAALGYSRGHYARFGTRLAPCCLNGLGWGYLHAAAPRQFRFADLDLYRDLSGMGWQARGPARP